MWPKPAACFDKYGLDVDIQPVKSGTEAIAFLSEGQVDVGGIAIVTSLWNGWNQGLDLRIFAPGGLEPFENSPTKLIVRKALADDGSVTEHRRPCRAHRRCGGRPRTAVASTCWPKPWSAAI